MAGNSQSVTLSTSVAGPEKSHSVSLPSILQSLLPSPAIPGCSSEGQSASSLVTTTQAAGQSEAADNSDYGNDGFQLVAGHKRRAVGSHSSSKRIAATGDKSGQQTKTSAQTQPALQPKLPPSWYPNATIGSSSFTACTVLFHRVLLMPSHKAHQSESSSVGRGLLSYQESLL